MPSVRGGQDPKLVKSGARVFAVLEYFDRVQHAASSVEIAQALNIPLSSASALARTMASLGYLEYDTSTRRYKTTLRVALLGDWVRGSPSGGRKLIQVIAHLAQSFGHTISVAMRNGAYLQYVYVLPSELGSDPKPKPGDLAPLTRSAMGWIVLASLPTSDSERIVRRLNATEDANLRVEPTWLQAQLDQTRANGAALCTAFETASVAIRVQQQTTAGFYVVGMESGAPISIDEAADIAISMRKTVEQFFISESDKQLHHE